jgi:hypothetical protein
MKYFEEVFYLSKGYNFAISGSRHLGQGTNSRGPLVPGTAMPVSKFQGSIEGISE